MGGIVIAAIVASMAAFCGGAFLGYWCGREDEYERGAKDAVRAEIRRRLEKEAKR